MHTRRVRFQRLGQAEVAPVLIQRGAPVISRGSLAPASRPSVAKPMIPQGKGAPLRSPVEPGSPMLQRGGNVRFQTRRIEVRTPAPAPELTYPASKVGLPVPAAPVPTETPRGAPVPPRQLPPPPPLNKRCDPPNHWIMVGQPGGWPCTWVCSPRDTKGKFTIPCKPPQGWIAGRQQGSSSVCSSGFYRPGITGTDKGCECKELLDPNSNPGQLSLAGRSYTYMLETAPRAAAEWLNKQTFNLANRPSGIMDAMAQYQAAWEFAKTFGLCWPLQYEDLAGDGGAYVRAGQRAAGVLIGLRSLVYIMNELRTSTASAGSGGNPQYGWPPAVQGKDAKAVFGTLTIANNVVARYVNLVRELETQVFRARDSLSICRSRGQRGAGREGTLFGYHGPKKGGLRGQSLGELAPVPPQPRENFFAYYYLSLFPTLAQFLPDTTNPSIVANELDRRINETVSYGRQLREELEGLRRSAIACERGFDAPPPPTSTPPGGGLADPKFVPEGGISHLPSPYAGAIPGATAPDPNAPAPPSYQRATTDNGSTAQSAAPEGIGSMALLAIAGAALLYSMGR